MSLRLAYLALALLAIAVRLPGVWHDALSQDEVFSARIISEPTLSGAVRHIVRTESTPPLWYVLGWLTHRVGVPIVEVRLLSVLFGGLLAAAVFGVARAVIGSVPAAFTGALVAVGYQPVYHGSELRSYELMMLLAALLVLVLLRVVRAPSRRLDVTLAATVSAGALTHYFFAYTVAATLVWLWFEPAARAVRRRAMIAIAAGGALAALWLPAFVVQYRNDHFWWIGRFSFQVLLMTPLRLFVPYPGQSMPVAAAALLALAAGLVALARRSAAGRLVALLAVFPLVVSGSAWAAGERTYAVRNLVETAPFIAVAFAAALALVPRRAVTAAAAVTTVTAIAVVTVTQSLPPTQALARALLAEGWGPSDPIAVYGNFFRFRAPLEWYLPHAGLLDVSEPTDTACHALFVIAGAERRLPSSHVQVRERAGGYVIARLAGVSRLKHTTLLATTRKPSHCVRLSTNPRLKPLA